MGHYVGAQHAIPFLWRFHGVYHSIERLAAGSGFHHLAAAPVRAILVTVPLSLIWDRLFGTAYFPNAEWPEVGLSDRREPRSVSDFLFQPFSAGEAVNLPAGDIAAARREAAQGVDG